MSGVRLTPEQAVAELAAGGDRPCLIHTAQRDLWWRADRRGYTDDRSRAGRYGLAEAIRIIATSGPEKGNTIEILTQTGETT